MDRDWDKDSQEENNREFDDNDGWDEQKASRIRSLWKRCQNYAMAHVFGLQVTFILAQTDLFPYCSVYANVAQVRAEKHTAHMLSARHIASKTRLAHCSSSR